MAESLTQTVKTNDPLQSASQAAAITVWLRRLLVVLGSICLLALFAVLMPREWIARSHAWMGLGAFPEAPIAEYLARSTSALCAFYGGFVLMLARDPLRYLPIVKYQAIAMLALSAMSMVVWLRLGMEAHWVLLDVLGGWGILLPILILAYRLEPLHRNANDPGMLRSTRPPA